MLRSLFPRSYKYTNSVGSFILGIFFWFLESFIAWLILIPLGLITGWIPIVGWILGIILIIIDVLIGVRLVAGIVVQFLVFFKVLKK